MILDHLPFEFLKVSLQKRMDLLYVNLKPKVRRVARSRFLLHVHCILALQDIENLSRNVLENVWKMFGKCLEMFGKCSENVWKCLRNVLTLQGPVYPNRIEPQQK